MQPDASPHVNDVGGGLDTIPLAKGKSAVMNNVCKSEEGVKGGRESKGRREMGGGAGSCLLRS